ncbi:zinc-dependent metalloprotease [bacterium]|nr:zinc-dependent metalloprotease [bacterium]
MLSRHALARAGSAALALAFGLAVTARADEPKKAGKDNEKAVHKPDDAPAAAAEEKEEEEFAPFDKSTKGFELTSGFWDLYYKAKDQALLGVIPHAELEKPFLITSSISGGTRYSGWQWFDSLVAWERVGKKLVLVERNVHYRAEPEKPIAEAVLRTYSDRVIGSLPILSESPKGFLIDLRALLVERPGDLLQAISIDSSLAKVAKRKVFPTNVELAFSAPLAGDGALVSFHYSIAKLPEQQDYAPRLADDRIGYFLTAVKDFTKGDPREQRFLRFVNRWDLRKASPELALSPPRKPIVFYIEKTVPFSYRRFVEAGILEWNRAFEKIGFSNAVVVRQQTADNEFKDFDPEDARYNFFRWIVSEEAYAMGPSRVDPRTGQILDADIVFDDSMVEAYAGEYETLLKEGPKIYRSAQENESSRAFGQHLSLALEPLGVKLDPEKAAAAYSRLTEGAARLPAAKTRAELDASLRARAPHGVCRIGEGAAHELALAHFARLAAEAGEEGDPKKGAGALPDDYVGEVIKETVMHEVGHTLGLRHNFKGSSWRKLEEINSPERPGDISASIMDYNPINIAPEGMTQGHYQNVLLGPYDVWAIEYGYKPSDETSQVGPKELADIASRSAEPGHAYGTDEDLASPDPLIGQWDMGQDPIVFAKSRISLATRLREKLLARAVRAGEGWDRLRRAFEMVLYEQARAGQIAARLVGGSAIHRDHKGDPGERAPLVLVPAAQQRAALAFACEQVFDEKALQFTPELLSHLAAGRWSHWGSNDDGAELAYPIHERVLAVQRYTLNQLLSETTLHRVRDSQVKAAPGEDVLSVSEIFATLEKAIFRELEPSSGAPRVSSFRQNLQDLYVRDLTNLALEQEVPGPTPANVGPKKVAWLRLKGLQERCQNALATGKTLDEETRAHLESMARRAEKVREADYVHIASGCSLSNVPGAPAALLPLAALLVLLVGARRRKLSAR